MVYPDSLSELIDNFKKFPSIGEKTAERLSLALVDFKKEDIDAFVDSIIRCQNTLNRCSICGHICDGNICDVCNDSRRKDNVICILEDYKSVFAFEKIGNFSGKYHVLNGLISPIDGVNPEDINIESLLKRIDLLDNVEIIIALKSTIEGETTSLYLQKILNAKNVVISRLSYGIPMGTDLDYLDEMTLDRALEDRKIVS